MQIKKFLTSLLNKIKYDENGQLSSFATPIRTIKSIQGLAAYVKRQAALKKSKPITEQAQVTSPTTKQTPKLYNPWQGLTTQQIREKEAARVKKVGYYSDIYNPPGTGLGDLGITSAPKTSTVPAVSPEINTKVLAYLKEYVGQMRAAGFSDYLIREKLLKTGSVFIPDQLPTNFGQTGPWATGMADEFRFAAMESGKNQQGLLEDWVPSPNEYMEYMPGAGANRLPSYSEYTGQETSPFMSPAGKFSQDKIANLQSALVNYMTTYKGPTVSPSQYTYEAGIAGLPQGLGQQYYQDFLALAEQKAEEAKGQEEYKEELKGQQEVYKGELFSKIAAELDNVIYQAAANDESISLTDVMKYASDRGIELSYEEALDIFNAAYKRYSESW